MLATSRLQAIVCVSDLARAEQFYGGTLGLALVGRQSGSTVYDVGGTHLRVSPVESMNPAEHTVLGFAVDDLDSVVAELHGRGVVPERFAVFSHDPMGIVAAPDGSRVFWLRDPDGNLLSVVQFAQKAGQGIPPLSRSTLAAEHAANRHGARQGATALRPARAWQGFPPYCE